jgi:predicted lipase
MTAHSPFDIRLALSLARGIAATYPGPNQTIQPTFHSRITDTQGFIGQHDGRFTILFPGTASMRDLLTDLMFRKTKWNDEGCFVHRGAVGAWRSVIADVMEQTRGAKSVIIGGHSLGGMLGTLCADVLAREGVQVIGVYTFGSPRVGNGQFAEQYDAKLAGVTYRIWNAGDPVPCVPPPIPTPTSGMYRHVAHEFYLTEGGNLKIDPAAFWHWLEILGAIRSPLSALASLDHPINTYITKLEAMT